MKNIKIILVDDDEDDRMLFTEAFEELKLNANLFVFENGNKLLNFLKEVDDYMGTHIFLDLNMPVISGMECLKKIREFTDRNIPLVTIYSTSSAQADIEEAYKLGANGYLIKPSSYSILKESLEKSILEGISN
ncbi:response regulator receiver domain-containing protein [Mariniflexile fucanivorans]|uniref:Response regulator receiver domain-containing protein n=1 Tax=Mariniflexile fucanivorans TaxID=264023 RepID=A0A4R1RMJ5_9FLAO|nr:response regulator [Mariniflexile fucanivorans]TCL67501.1 response regulator receiver domain-containing protein [Mariniflexile fucanivorans]